MRPLEIKLLKGCGGLVLLFVVAAIFWPAFPGYPAPIAVACLSNVKQGALGIVLYTNDFDDRFPPRDAWMDATFPYVKREEVWHCPSVPKAAYGYAFNGALSRAKTPKDPQATSLIYDSVNPIRNASDLCVSLPLPGRHGRKEEGGRNNVAYADGHAKGIPARPVVH